MPNIGPLELAVVVMIAIVVLGPKKLPEAGRSVGQAIKEFRGTTSGSAPSDSGPARDDEAARERAC